MKKILLLSFIAIAIGLSSCDDGKPHCWDVTTKATFMGKTETGNAHAWGTADEIDAQITLAKAFAEAMGATDVKISKKKVKLSEADCKAKIEEERKE